jgi:hypothetical protein
MPAGAGRLKERVLFWRAWHPVKSDQFLLRCLKAGAFISIMCTSNSINLKYCRRLYLYPPFPQATLSMEPCSSFHTYSSAKRDYGGQTVGGQLDMPNYLSMLPLSEFMDTRPQQRAGRCDLRPIDPTKARHGSRKAAATPRPARTGSDLGANPATTSSGGGDSRH